MTLSVNTPSGRRILLSVVAVVLFALPVGAGLGWLGLISTASPLPSKSISWQSGSFRVKKAQPPLTRNDQRHALIRHYGTPLLKKSTASELSAPDARGLFWIREQNIRLQPFQTPSQGPKALDGYELVRPWSPTAQLLWIWGGLLMAMAAVLWLRRDFLNALKAGLRETRRALHHGIQFVSQHQHHGAYLALYASLLTIGLAWNYQEKIKSPFLVAEDGSLFLQENLAFGSSAIALPYAGYLHSYPRLFIWVAGHFPLESQASVLVWLCMGSMWLIFFSIARWSLDWREQWLVAAFLLLAPFGNYLMLSITNLQWFMGIALILLACHPAPSPRSRLGQITVGTGAFVAALTGPFAVITFPWFCLQACIRRTSFHVILALSQLIAVSIQAWAIVLHHQTTPHETVAPRAVSLADWLGDFVLGLFGGALDLPDRWTTPVGLALGSIVAIAFGWVLLHGKTDPERRRRLFLLLASAALFAVAGWLRTHGDTQPWNNGDRYYVVPYALLAISLPSLLLCRVKGLSLLGVVLMLAMVAGLRQTPPSWISPPGWAEQVRQIAPGEDAFIETWPPGPLWTVYLIKGPDGKFLTGPAYLNAARLKKVGRFTENHR